MQYQSPPVYDELVAFVAVVEAHGFSAAARATGGRKATLSKRVQDLEARLGLPLLMRTTRSLRLTEEGQAYFEHARRSLAAARDAEAVVVSARSKPQGLLRVTTSASLAAPMVEHVVAKFLARYPQVTLHLDNSERRVDLVREGFDVAVRVGPLEDSSLVARRLGRVTGGFYASPAYLARRPAPTRPQDVAAHDTILIPKAEAASEWPFWVQGKVKHVPVRPRLVVWDLETAARAAVAGVGIVRAPLQVVAPYLRRKALVPVLGEWTLPGLDVSALLAAGGGLVPKTRAFVDMLEAWFRRTPDDAAVSARAGARA